jgi:LysM repeat protein
VIDRVTDIRDQAKAFEQLNERFDRLESSMSLSTEHIAKGLDSLPAKMAKEIPQKAVSSRSSKVSKRMSKKSYHTVSAGETLYGISLRYGLTVKKIRLLNKLNNRFVICPGQKLLVTL